MTNLIQNLNPRGPITLPPEPASEENITAGWKGNFGRPLVSIICITFNHGKYLKHAIDGFLFQKTNFPFEIVIHNDCSTDATRDIIDAYVKRYPSIIKAIHQTENQFSQGKSPILIAPKHASGEFFALCEGDDYWIDSAKLQKQADFLLNNPDASAITHQSLKFFEDDRIDPCNFCSSVKQYWELEDLLFGRKYHTASVMLRGDILRNNGFPTLIVSVDKALSFLLLSHGKIAYLNDTMCVYRKHENGISSWVTAEIMATDLNLLPWLQAIHPHFPVNKYRSIIHHTVFTYPSHIKAGMALKHYFLFCVYSFSYFPGNVKPLVSSFKSLLKKLIKNTFVEKGIWRRRGSIYPSSNR